MARIVIDGDTCIRQGEQTYRGWKEFPDALKSIILENPDGFRSTHPEYDVIRQGRFLLSVVGPDGRIKREKTCKCTGMSADQLRDMLDAELEEGLS